MPLLSIITINYNNRAGLELTMKSVFGQTWTDYEYLVIDGGSDDGSREYIESNARKLKYWVSEKDAGIFNAQNKGAKKSSGNYLLFLNSGDVLASADVLEKYSRHFGSHDLVYGDLLVEKDGEK